MPETAGSSWPGSVAILGAAGLIGSGVAAALATPGACRRLYLVDPRANLLQAHAIDIGEAQLVSGGATTSLVPCAADDVPEVDLTVVAASAPETPNGDRKDFLAANLRLLRQLVPTVRRAAGTRGVVLLLSNPVDVLAEALHRLADLEPERIVGYSLNDSVRFRLAVGRELGVSPDRVDAWVLGEHGTGQVPLFSRIRVDGEPVELAPEARARVRADVDGWFARWSALEPGRSSGWTTAAGTLATIAALGSGQVHPASVWTGGHAGLPATFVTLPAHLSPRGREGVADWPLAQDEQEQLLRAAGSVHALASAALAEEATAASL
jgi:malate/lactate dehydrogenase